MRVGVVGFMLACMAYGAPSDPAADVWDVVATMAAALAEPNDAAFMRPIAKSVEHYELLERQVRSLSQTNGVVSSITAVLNDGDDKQRTLEVDWYMELQPKSPGQTFSRRRETVRMTFAKSGKRWMITSLTPVAFFAPPPSGN